MSALRRGGKNYRFGRGHETNGRRHVAILIVTVGAANTTTAQGYPERAVQIIVPSTPGSSADGGPN
jgi:hypothetical protein